MTTTTTTNERQRDHRRPGGKRRPMRREKPEFDNRLLDLARVTRVVKGGRRFSFRATVVVGDRKGRVGVGVAKGTDVSSAMQKAINDGKKHLITVPIKDNTIPHEVAVKKGSAKLIMKPAPAGSGVIAGGAVRAVVDLAGIRDVVAKSLGTSNKINVARAACAALDTLSAAPRRAVTNRKNAA